MATFEYKIVPSTNEGDESDETMLNDYGAEGWELVTVHFSAMSFDAETEGEEDSEEFLEEVPTYYLKRAKA